MSEREQKVALLGRLAVATTLLCFAAYASARLGGLRWNFDEGIEVHKAWLASDGYRLFDPIWTDQPVGHALALALVFRILEPGIAQARALTVAFGLIGMAGTALAARELCRDGMPRRMGAPAWPAWLAAATAAALLAIAPNFNWAARAVMMGIPTFSLATLSVAFALGYARRRSTRWLVASAAALGLALAIKVQMIYLGPLFGLLVMWLRRRELRLLVVELGLLAILGLGPLVLMMVTYGPTTVWAQVFGTYAETRNDYVLDVGANLRVLTTWTYADNFGLAVLAGAGALLCALRRSITSVLALAWLFLTVVTPLQHAALWAEDHFEPLLFCLCALAGVAAAELASRIASARAPVSPDWRAARGRSATVRDIAVAAVCVLGLVAYCLWVPRVVAVNRSLSSARGYENDGTLVVEGTPYWFEVQEAEAQMRSAIAYLAAHSGPDEFVMTDDQILAFHAGRRVPPELAAISSRRVRIRAISGSELISIAERYDPAVILPWKSQLTHFDSFAEWLTRSRRPDESWTETRVAYLRAAGPDR